jgi:hypothetical protein
MLFWVVTPTLVVGETCCHRDSPDNMLIRNGGVRLRGYTASSHPRRTTPSLDTVVLHRMSVFTACLNPSFALGT